MLKFLGTIGVDLFFVLSGYLIGGIIIVQIEAGKTGFIDFLNFWKRRWFKTLPNYFLILVLNILIFYAFNGYILEGVSRYFIFVQNFSSQMPDFFTESWSLSIEEFSYIIGPLLLYLVLLLKWKKKKHLFLFITVSIIALGIITRYWFNINDNLLGFEDWSHNLRKVVIYRIDSIYYGFIGAYVSYYAFNFWKASKNLSLVIAVILFTTLHGLIYYYSLNPKANPDFFNIYYIPLLMISLLCFFPFISNLKTASIRFKNIVEYISKSSYAIYLVNYSLILLSLQFLVVVPELNIISKILFLMLFWGSTFIFSFLLYTYFEIPIMRFRDKINLSSHDKKL